MSFADYDFAGDTWDNPDDSWDGGSPDTPTYPFPVINVALTDPLSQFPEYVNVTPWCKNADTAYGRQHELQQIEAQTIAANMDDITGLFSPWNFQSPFTNLLQYSDSVIPNTGGTNNWVAGSATEISPSGGGLDPTLPALLLERLTTTSGDISASIGVGVVGYVAVSGGIYYSGFAAFEALTTGRSCTVGLAWYDSSFSLISTSTGSAVSDTTSGYTKATVTDVAPSGAAWASLVITVESADSGEFHLACRFGITQRFVDSLVSNGPLVLDVTAFGPGGYGLTAGRSLQLTASTDNITIYPINFAYVESLVPTVVDELNKTVMINASDAFKFFANDVITSSLYPGLVVLDGACLYWRLGDPVGTYLVGDFSQNGNLGVADYEVAFGQPGLIDADANEAVGMAPLSVISQAQVFNAPQTSATMEIWIGGMTPAPGSAAPLCSMGPGVGLTGVIQTRITSGGVVEVVAGVTTITGSLVVTDGLIHHIVVTYDGTSGELILYVDGLESNGATGTATTGLLTGTFHALITNDGALNTFTADEFAIYPFVLTDVQVADHYDIGEAGGGYAIPRGSTDCATLILLLLLGGGFPLWMMSFELSTVDVVCPTLTTGTTPLLSTVNQVVASENGLLYQDRTGMFVFLNRDYALTAPAATTIQGIFENSPSSGLYYLPAGFQPTLDDSDLWNDVPTQTNSNSTVYDPSAIGPLYDAQDITSITHFGKRTLQGYTSLLYANQSDTQDLGQFLLTQYSIPFTRIRSAQISSAANQGAALQQMFERDLFDLLAFIYHPQDAGEDFDESAQLEKVQHKITPGLWVTTWQLNPYSVGANSWFTLGDAVYGVLAGPGSDAANRLGYHHRPYSRTLSDLLPAACSHRRRPRRSEWHN